MDLKEIKKLLELMRRSRVLEMEVEEESLRLRVRFQAAAGAMEVLSGGLPLPQAVEKAKKFITAAIQTNPGLGHGHGPVNHHVWGRETEVFDPMKAPESSGEHDNDCRIKHTKGGAASEGL